jgi:hypothetical protein
MKTILGFDLSSIVLVRFCFQSGTASNQRNPDNEIIITTSDKGNKSVILYKNDYIKGMKDLLSDSKTYEKLDSNPTEKIQRKCNALVRKTMNDSNVDAMEKLILLKCICYNGVIPKLYGNPKTHKLTDGNDEVKFRPIVSCVKSPTYNLSKLLCMILRNSIEVEPHIIRNSFEFKEFIVTQKVPPNHKVISVDVVSLFTNLPIKLIVEIIETNWNDIQCNTSFTKERFIECIKFCQENCVLAFNNEFYQQKEGSGMGLPKSPPEADLVMEFVTKLFIEKLPFPVPFFKRYVDDCVTIVPQDMVDKTMEILNSINDSIKFTVEVEENNRIPFLDMMLIINKDGSIETKWHQKAYASLRMLSYRSVHPLSQKIGAAYGLINRALKLTSEAHKDDVKKMVRDILLKNDYPKSLINRLMSRQSARMAQRDVTGDQQTIIRSLTYIRGLSERLGKIIQDENPNIRMAFKPIRSMSPIYSRLKDIDEKWVNSYVIYAIPCNGDGVLVCFWYVGQTIQYLKERIKDHRRDMELYETAKSNNDWIEMEKLVKRSAMVKHIHETNHKFDYDNTAILMKTSDRYKLNYLEMFMIQNNHTCNKRTDVQKLSLAYSNILNTLKNLNDKNHR